jgi:hydroxyacylglutathione hydrolase
MKRDNKAGPAVLNGLPVPPKIPPAEIPALLEEPSNVFLDARLDRNAFFQSHLRGSLFVPLNGKFNTVAGSFVTEEETIYLLLERDDQVVEAVRQLIRIGLDKIGGYALVDEVRGDDSLNAFFVATESATTAGLDSLRKKHTGAVVLDVRTAAEHAEGHAPGALNIAYTRLRDRLDEIPPDSKCLVHCKSGMRAAFAASLLERLGRDVVYLNGPVEDLLPAASSSGTARDATPVT